MITGTDNLEITYAYGVPLDDLPKYSRKPQVGDAKTEVHEGINYELLDEILAYVKAHPQTWRQESWYKIVDKTTGAEHFISDIENVEEVNSCGASFCFAGHVAIHEGFPSPPLHDGEWNRFVAYPDGWRISDGRTGRYEEVSEFAMKRLGLNTGQADALFDGSNSLEDLEDIVKMLHLAPEIRGWELEGYKDHKDYIPYGDEEHDPSVEGYLKSLNYELSELNAA